MAEVYWIRLPEHTDMFTEGYIGVTTKTAKERFSEHVKASKLNKKHHLKISYAILKYGAENLLVETLIICDEPYALEVEEKLRPDVEIGWNLAKGGSKPPPRKGPMGPEFSAKLSERNRGKPKSEETRKKISEALTGKSFATPESKAKVRETFYKNYTAKGLKKKPMPEAAILAGAHTSRRSLVPVEEFWEHPKFNIDSDVCDKMFICSKADVLYEQYVVREGAISCKLASESIGLDGDNRTVKRNIGKYLCYFKSGWIPLEDLKWVEKFKES